MNTDGGYYIEEDLDVSVYLLLYDNKLEPKECPSEESCALISEFFSNTETEKLYYDKIRITKQEILDKENLLEELVLTISNLKKDISYLKDMLSSNYNAVWKFNTKYKS